MEKEKKTKKNKNFVINFFIYLKYNIIIVKFINKNSY